MAQSVILKNEHLQAEILLDWDYRRSRYDWGGTVGQVTMNGHTFLSEERNTAGGVGLGGVGLTNVWEWQDTHLYDQTSIADFFPLPGVGLLKRTDTNPFLFTKDYPVEPYQRIVSTEENKVSIRTLPHLCQGIAHGLILVELAVFAADVDVGIDVGRRWRDIHQIRQQLPGGRASADPVQHRYRIHRLSGGVQLPDGFVNGAVGFHKILRSDAEDDLAGALGVNQDAAKDRLLGVHPLFADCHVSTS